MPELWLVCEGEPRSIDLALLQPVFANLNAEIVVEPACGSNCSVVARYLQLQRGGCAAYVHDRDYRERQDVETCFTNGKPGFFWRRHSIENYLLPPPIILRALQRLRTRFERQFPGRSPAWMARLPASREPIVDGLRLCAQQRAAEEACRQATRRLWSNLPASVGQVQQRVPGDSVPPNSTEPSAWRESLCLEAERVRNSASGVATASQFERASIARYFDDAYSEFTATPYLTNLEFLLDYCGRDLISDLCRWMNASFSATLTLERFIEELLSAAIEEYTIDRTVYGTDDFRDLANGVRKLAGLDETS